MLRRSPIIRLLESRQLWMLIEEIVESPAVMAAITRQGLGFADQVGARHRIARDHPVRRDHFDHTVTDRA